MQGGLFGRLQRPRVARGLEKYIGGYHEGREQQIRASALRSIEPRSSAALHRVRSRSAISFRLRQREPLPCRHGPLEGPSDEAAPSPRGVPGHLTGPSFRFTPRNVVNLIQESSQDLLRGPSRQGGCLCLNRLPRRSPFEPSASHFARSFTTSTSRTGKAIRS